MAVSVCAGRANEPPALTVDSTGHLYVEDVEALVAMATAFPVTPPSVDAVAAMTKRHRAFAEKAAKVCADATAWQAWHAARAAVKAGTAGTSAQTSSALPPIPTPALC